MIFTSLAGVAQGYLDAYKHFLPAKLCSLFFSVSIIVSVLAFKKLLGLRSLLFGFMFGYLVHTIYIVSLVILKTGLFIGNPFRDVEFRQMMKRFMPLVVGNFIIDLGHLIDRIVASSLAAGSVSALYYGQVLSSDIVNAVIVSSVGTVLLTTLTKKVSDCNDLEEINNQLQTIICTMTLFAGLISTLYFVEGIDFFNILVCKVIWVIWILYRCDDYKYIEKCFPHIYLQEKSLKELIRWITSLKKRLTDRQG